MEFKIDTKDTFSIITPVAHEISANLAEALATRCIEMRQNGSNNFIVDLQNINNADAQGLDILMTLNEECYSADCSLVFTSINTQLMMALNNEEAGMLLNIAPQMTEAIDIISMEILERDLLSEE